jgi:hypothetical protein
VAGLIEPASVPDAGAFLAWVLRLDPAAAVRLRPAPGGVVALWAHLPFEVLVTRGVRAAITEDLTVRADELLTAVERGAGLPPRREASWRWPLPPTGGRVVERIPADEVRRLAAAAAAAAQSALTGGVAGRAVGSRMVRDALLDHEAIVVFEGSDRLAVSQRLVQAVTRMNFLSDEPVSVRRAGAWIGLGAQFGAAWQRAGGGPVLLPHRPNG